LGVPVRVILPSLRLAVGLQAVPQARQQPADRLVADLVPQADERLGKVAGALTGPQQGGRGVAAGGRSNGALDGCEQRAISGGVRRAAAPRAANAAGVGLARAIGSGTAAPLSDASAVRRSREARGGGDEGDPAPAEGLGLTGGPAAARLLMKQRGQRLILLPNGS